MFGSDQQERESCICLQLTAAMVGKNIFTKREVCVYSLDFLGIFKVFSDCNMTRTQSHLVRKRTLNHLVSLTKWLSVRLRTKWF